MSTPFRYVGGDPRKKDGSDFAMFVNKEIIFQLDDWKRASPGSPPTIFRRLDDTNTYTERDGIVLNKVTGEAVPVTVAANLYVHAATLRLKVISPQVIRVETAGSFEDVIVKDRVMTLGLKLKGFRVEPNLFEIDGAYTGAMRAFRALGFSWELANQDSKQFYDPNYVMSRLKTCDPPLTMEQVLDRVFLPIMREARTEGRLVVGHTKKTSAWIDWRLEKGGFLAPLEPALASVVWKAVEEFEANRPETPVQSEPQPAPFSGDVQLTPVVEYTTEEIDRFKVALYEAVRGKECVLIGEDNETRIAEMRAIIREIVPGFRFQTKMLSHVTPAQLAELHARIFPVTDVEEAL